MTPKPFSTPQSLLFACGAHCRVPTSGESFESAPASPRSSSRLPWVLVGRRSRAGRPGADHLDDAISRHTTRRLPSWSRRLQLARTAPTPRTANARRASRAFRTSRPYGAVMSQRSGLRDTSPVAGARSPRLRDRWCSRDSLGQGTLLREPEVPPDPHITTPRRSRGFLTRESVPEEETP